MNKTISMY